jgi:hypothetical protein
MGRSTGADLLERRTWINPVRVALGLGETAGDPMPGDIEQFLGVDGQLAQLTRGHGSGDNVTVIVDEIHSANAVSDL